MPVERMLPTPEAEDLIGLVRDIADAELAPRADDAEANAAFPTGVIRKLGSLGLLGLPYDEEFGGGGQPYEVYLQVLEELAARWATVALTVSVHTMASWPLAAYGTEEQRKQWLPEMVGGDTLVAYCLSEPHAGSDAAALSTRAVRTGGDYVISGTKAWISHAPHADFFTVLARTSDDGPRGITCFYVPAGVDGLSFGAPERKMGLSASPTSIVNLDGVRIPADHRIGGNQHGLVLHFGF